MPQLHPPPGAPERHEPGRHGRRHRRGRPPVGVHAFHLFIAVVPAALVACLGVAAVAALIVLGSSARQARLALVATAIGALIVICLAAFGASRATRRELPMPSTQVPAQQEVARQLADQQLADQQRAAENLRWRISELAYLIARGRQELRGLIEQVAAGEAPTPRLPSLPPSAAGDPFVYLAHEIQQAQNETWNAVIDAARPEQGPVQRVDIFVNLARRMQTLSHRAIQGLDELESGIEDPELLKGLFRVDHLITRLRRQAESLAVIGGAPSRRIWSRPVTMHEVLRSAISEVEYFSRIKIAPTVEGNLDGGAVADVIHLIAELAENATRFAPPHTEVILRAEAVTAGLAIEIEDRGLGIPGETQHRLNELLSDPEQVESAELLKEGRIGLLVVAALSRRYKIVVKLRTSIYGGTQAVVIIPKELISSEAGNAGVAEEGAGTTTLAEPAPVSSAPGSWPAPEPRTHPVEAGQDEPVRDEPAPVAGGAERPALPRRRAQDNLVPELRQAPRSRSDDSGARHNPGLTAAFRKGMRSGEEEG